MSETNELSGVMLNTIAQPSLSGKLSLPAVEDVADLTDDTRVLERVIDRVRADSGRCRACLERVIMERGPDR